MATKITSKQTPREKIVKDKLREMVRVVEETGKYPGELSALYPFGEFSASVRDIPDCIMALQVVLLDNDIGMAKAINIISQLSPEIIVLDIVNYILSTVDITEKKRLLFTSDAIRSVANRKNYLVCFDVCLLAMKLAPNFPVSEKNGVLRACYLYVMLNNMANFERLHEQYNLMVELGLSINE